MPITCTLDQGNELKAAAAARGRIHGRCPRACSPRATALTLTRRSTPACSKLEPKFIPRIGGDPQPPPTVPLGRPRRLPAAPTRGLPQGRSPRGPTAGDSTHRVDVYLPDDSKHSRARRQGHSQGAAPQPSAFPATRIRLRRSGLQTDLMSSARRLETNFLAGRQSPALLRRWS